MAGVNWPAPAAWTSRNTILVLILLVASILRFQVSATKPYMWDEDHIAIPLAESISFSAETLNLPVRGLHHPALPSYFVKISGALFGKTPIGYRAVHLIAGLFTILVIFRVARLWYGSTAALWTAAFLALNEYHIAVSAYATAKGPHLLFVALAIYVFSRFLKTQRPWDLYATGIAVALAFYCKEHSVLLLPVCFLTLLRARYRHWLRGAHVYAACGLFFVLIGADIIWNFSTSQTGAHATYRDHFSRVGGVGFTVYPFLFFARGAIQWLSEATTGEALPDDVVEYPSMNTGFGLLLLGAVLATTFGPPKPGTDDRIRGFLLILFWVVLGFFVLIRPGQPTKGMDAVAWYWVDMTLFPAVILAGSVLASAQGWWRMALWPAAAAAMLYAAALMTWM